MRIIAINGSPRKKWNTEILLNKALDGAKSMGAETELIQLYDLNFKGCISCFACKRKGGKSYGKCALKDDLTPVLEKLGEADAIFFGSPIYFANITGEMRSCLERLLFQYLVYNKDHSSLAPKKIQTGFIYTMNVNESQMNKSGYVQTLSNTENSLAKILGSNDTIYCHDTYQFDDYSKYEASAFNAEDKEKVREEQFPIDCQKAFDLGVKFATNLK